MPSNTTPYRLLLATISGLRPCGLRFLLLGINNNLSYICAETLADSLDLSTESLNGEAVDIELGDNIVTQIVIRKV